MLFFFPSCETKIFLDCIKRTCGLYRHKRMNEDSATAAPATAGHQAEKKCYSLNKIRVRITTYVSIDELQATRVTKAETKTQVSRKQSSHSFVAAETVANEKLHIEDLVTDSFYLKIFNQSRSRLRPVRVSFSVLCFCATASVSLSLCHDASSRPSSQQYRSDQICVYKSVKIHPRIKTRLLENRFEYPEKNSNTRKKREYPSENWSTQKIEYSTRTRGKKLEPTSRVFSSTRTAPNLPIWSMINSQ
ncbi:unnamed protein product, partial [Trichogramma brassicae]